MFFFECETRLFGRLGSLAFSSLVSHSLSNRNSRTGVGFGLLLRYRVEDRKRHLFLTALDSYKEGAGKAEAETALSKGASSTGVSNSAAQDLTALGASSSAFSATP